MDGSSLGLMDRLSSLTHKQPVGVFFERGCGVDLLINIFLTLLCYIPGLIHACFIIIKY
ncbi:unnamed protein product [Thelazia callipaeda]|uniref:UPF0057-domain-containing protein n=1 Tax=Thelazia callipaeda TaxID=103827 RepID=A0A0N5CS65_THECL|nr:unnamed protein product [Thelazia callipaeda]